MKRFLLVLLASLLLFVSCSGEKNPPLENGALLSYEEMDVFTIDEYIAELTSQNSELEGRDPELYEDFIEAINVSLDEEMLDEIQREYELAGEDFSEFNKENASASFLIKTWKINYQTTSVTGEPMKASGTVTLGYFPLGFKNFYPKLDYLLLHNHVTIGANKECPSNDKAIMGENTVVRLLALNDAAVISPDYEGYGVSAKTHDHPYLVAEVTAQQSVDMLKAAITFMDNNVKHFRGYEEDCCLYNTGYSQGGGVSFGVHYLLESSEKALAEEWNFQGTFAGSGPYSPIATFEWYLNEYDAAYNGNVKNGIDDYSVSFPILFPLVIDSYLQAYGDTILKGYTLADFFQPIFMEQITLKKGEYGWTGSNATYANIVECVRSKKYIADEITLIMKGVMEKAKENGKELVVLDENGNRAKEKITDATVTVETILMPELFDSNSAIYKAIYEALRVNDVEYMAEKLNGTLNYKLRLYHAFEDDVVPYVNAKRVREAFNNTNVEFQNARQALDPDYIADTTKQGEHVAFGTNFMAIELYLYRNFKVNLDYTI